jgi:hypothetical protein
LEKITLGSTLPYLPCPRTLGRLYSKVSENSELPNIYENKGQNNNIKTAQLLPGGLFTYIGKEKNEHKQTNDNTDDQLSFTFCIAIGHVAMN